MIKGASSGIGEANELLLAERGAKVVLGAYGSDRLRALAARIADKGGESSYAPTDVRRRDDFSELVNLACERYGNSSTMRASHRSPLSTTTSTSKAFVRYRGSVARLPEARFSSNTASTAGQITYPNMAVYSATKFAVRAISEGLRQEAGDKLRVTIISPGFVQTNVADSIANPATKGQIEATMEKDRDSPGCNCPRDSVAIEQPHNVDVGEIIVRPTAQV